MKKIFLISVFIFCSMAFTSQIFNDSVYEKILYGYSKSIPLLKRYKLPTDNIIAIDTPGVGRIKLKGVNIDFYKSSKGNFDFRYRKVYKTEIPEGGKRSDIYDPLEYPRFEYPFHLLDDLDLRLRDQRSEPIIMPTSKKYAAVSGITMYQPEFNMLKRFYSPWKFTYKKLKEGDPELYMCGDSGGFYAEGSNFWCSYDISQNSLSVYREYGGITPGYPQGFNEGLSVHEFDAYYVYNDYDAFILVVPESLNMNKFSKERNAGVLFLGTELYGKADSMEYDVVDVVIIYDRKYVDYVRL